MTPATIRERRAGLGMTQAQFAHALGTTVTTVSRWESGSIAVGNPTILDLALETLERRTQK